MNKTTYKQGILKNVVCSNSQYTGKVVYMQCKYICVFIGKDTFVQNILFDKYIIRINRYRVSVLHK